MPNWVTNYLTVKEDVAKEFILNDKNEIDFEILIPMPEELRNTTAPCDINEELQKKYGASNWYDWSVNNWGCKWNGSMCDLEYLEDGFIRIIFDTPWSEPIHWLYKLAELKIDFHLAWYEEQGYRGIITAENGLIDNFELPEVKWTEDENGEYYSSEEKENFDWTLMQYDGQFEELMNTDSID